MLTYCSWYCYLLRDEACEYQPGHQCEDDLPGVAAGLIKLLRNDIEPAQWYAAERLYGYLLPIDRYFVGERVNPHGRHSVVEKHVLLAHDTCLSHRLQLPEAPQAFLYPRVERGLRDKCDRDACSAVAPSTEDRA